MTAALLGAGCTTDRPRTSSRPVPEHPVDPYLRTDIDELLRFASTLTEVDAVQRKEVCRDLLKREQERPQPGLQLHLLVGRTVTKSCGDIEPIIQAVSAIPADKIPDPRVRWLMAKDSATLREIQRLSRLASSRGPRTQKPKSADCPPSPQLEENRRLKQKLDELRTIERQMDGTNQTE